MKKNKRRHKKTPFNIHFLLRQQGLTNPIIVLWVFDYRFSAGITGRGATNRKFMYSTGKDIKSSLWDNAQERAKNDPELNQFLHNLNQRAIDFFRARLDHKSLVRDDLKKHLDGSLIDERKTQEDKLQRESDFFKVWQQIIDTTKGKGGEGISSNTKRSKAQTLRLVRQYCIDKKVKLSFETIDMEFYHALDLYMDGKGLGPNSKGKHMKEIKALLRECADRDINVNAAYLKKSFKVIRKDTDSTYLSEAELKRLLSLDLSDSLRRHCDVFVCAAFVGARHSDWHQIRQSNIVVENGKELLRLKQRKTGDVIHVPVHPVVRAILNKYAGTLPAIISNQKFNDCLKQICSHADAKLGKVTINGSQVEKSSQISTHSARRSFATNCYLSRSMDTYAIMKCTGHRTEASFLKYLKLNGRDFAAQAADSKFFNDPSWSLLTISKAS